MVQDAMTVQDVMMDPGVMTDLGGTGMRGQDLGAPPGDLAAVAGEIGSRKRMMSGDLGVAALEEETLLPGVDLHQDVDHLLARTGVMLDPGGVAEDHHPGEMTEEQEEAASREEVEAAAVTLEIVTCVVVVDLLLVAMIVEALSVAMAEMAATAPGEEEEVIVMAEIGKCVVEALLLAVMIVTCVVDLPGMMIVVTEDLLVTMDPMTGVVDLPDLPVKTVTDLVDPLVSRDQPEIKMMAGPLSRPSVNSQLCS